MVFVQQLNHHHKLSDNSILMWKEKIMADKKKRELKVKGEVKTEPIDPIVRAEKFGFASLAQKGKNVRD